MKSRTTFSVHPNSGLNVVVAEFPAPDAFPNKASNDFLRPMVGQANGMKASIAAGLTKLYGKPSYTKATGDGSITIWKGTEDFVRLTTVAIDSGRMDIRLWMNSTNEKFEPTTAQTKLEGVFTRTDSATWSKGGGMNAKWGMGPADVAEIYPDIVPDRFRPYEPTKKYSTNAFIEGSVGIDFYFYKGRLTEVRVGTCLRSGDPFINSDKARKENWDECQEWAIRCRKVLQEKYGQPLIAPSPEKVKEVEAAGAGLNRLEWAWRTQETGILFIRATIAMQILLYQDIGPAGREANEAEEAYKAAEEAARMAPF